LQGVKETTETGQDSPTTVTASVASTERGAPQYGKLTVIGTLAVRPGENFKEIGGGSPKSTEDATSSGEDATEELSPGQTTCKILKHTTMRCTKMKHGKSHRCVKCGLKVECADGTTETDMSLGNVKADFPEVVKACAHRRDGQGKKAKFEDPIWDVPALEKHGKWIERIVDFNQAAEDYDLKQSTFKVIMDNGFRNDNASYLCIKKLGEEKHLVDDWFPWWKEQENEETDVAPDSDLRLDEDTEQLLNGIERSD